MSALYIVLPLALLVVAVAIGAFLWAAKRGQFDDLETPAIRALHDDAEAGRSGTEEGGDRGPNGAPPPGGR